MLIPIVIFIIGLAGAASLSYGAWLTYQPAGYLVAGIECLIWSYLMSQAIANKSRPTRENN